MIHIDNLYIVEAPPNHSNDMLVVEGYNQPFKPRHDPYLQDIFPLGAECVLDQHSRAVMKLVMMTKKRISLTYMVEVLRKFYPELTYAVGGRWRKN